MRQIEYPKKPKRPGTKPDQWDANQGLSLITHFRNYLHEQIQRALESARQTRCGDARRFETNVSSALLESPRTGDMTTPGHHSASSSIANSCRYRNLGGFYTTVCVAQPYLSFPFLFCLKASNGSNCPKVKPV